MFSSQKINKPHIKWLSLSNMTNIQPQDSNEVFQTNMETFMNLHNLYSDYSDITHFNLARSNFTIFPDVLLKNAIVIHLYDNNLNKIQDNIDLAVNLEILEVQSNNLEFLPDNICNLQKLNYLQLQDNKLKFLPENLSNCKNLETILMCHNESLESFPDLTSLTNFKYLQIDECHTNLIVNKLPFNTKIEFVKTKKFS